MEFDQIKTTNLSLLRKILEGKCDEVLQQLNCADRKVDDDLENANRAERKLRKKSKKRCRSDKKSEFYLSGDEEFIKGWLKEKEKIMRRKKREMVKQKLEEKRKTEMTNQENADRLVRARESYDRWLREIRNRDGDKPEKISHARSEQLDRNKSAQAAYKNWLNNKQNIGWQKSMPINKSIQSAPNETIVVNNDGVDTSDSKPTTDSQIKVRAHKRCNNRAKLTQSNLECEKQDDDMKNIIRDLRKAKLKQKEISRKRVDSGIFFIREDPNNRLARSAKSERFQWVLEDCAIEDTHVKSSRGDSRSRRVDQINHHHENPFIERNVDRNIKIKFD